MTIKQNNLINLYNIKTVFSLVTFYFFRYTLKSLVENYQGKIYLKYLGIERRIILKWIFKILMEMRGLDLYGSEYGKFAGQL